MTTAGVLERIRTFFDRSMKSANDRRDLALLDAREFSDLGVCRSDALSIVSGPRDVRDRITGMTGRLGLDVDEVMEPHWRAVDIARNCSNCRERRACRHYLKGHGPRDDYETFCPNAKTFAGLISGLHGTG